MKFLFNPAAFILILLIVSCSPEKPRLLLFSKAVSYKHESIKKGQAAILALAAKNEMDVDTTSDAKAFTDENLKK